MTLKISQAQATQLVSQERAQISATQGLFRWLPITLVLLLAAVVFSYRLSAEGLWLDELTSIQDANLTPFEVFKNNQLRPLYYLLLMAWMNVVGSGSDVGLRLLSVAFGLISVFLIYRLGRRVAGEPAGVIAAAMLTLSPLFVNHAQEIRMYILSLALGLAGTLFLVEVLLTERPQRPSQKTLAGWCLFRLLAIYTVPLNATLLLPDLLLLLWRFRREKAVLVTIAKWLWVLVVLWTPALFSVIDAASPSSTYATHRAKAKPPDAAVLFRSLKFLTVWPFAVQDNAIAAKFYKGFTLLLCGLISSALFLKRKSFRLSALSSSSSASSSASLWWLSAWWILPLVPIAAFSYLSIPIWVNRYILFVSPYLLILLAAGLTRLWEHWRPVAIAMATMYLIAVSGGLHRMYTVQDRPDYKFNIATLEQYEQPGDGLVWSYYYKKALTHYYDGDAKVYWAPLRDVETPEDTQEWLGYFPSGGYERLWLVLDGAWAKVEGIEDAIASQYSIEQTFDYERGSKIMLLTPLKEKA